MRHLGMVGLTALLVAGVAVAVPADGAEPAGGVRVVCDGWEHGQGVVVGMAPAGTELTVSRGYPYGDQLVSDGIVVATVVGDEGTFELEVPLRVNKPNHLSLGQAGGAPIGLQTLGPVPEYVLGTVHVELTADADVAEVLARNGVALERDGQPTWEAFGWGYRVAVLPWTEVEVAQRLAIDPQVARAELVPVVYPAAEPPTIPALSTWPPTAPQGCFSTSRWPVSQLRPLVLDALDRGRSTSEYRPLHVASSDPARWPDLVAAQQGALDVSWNRLALYDGGCALAADMIEVLAPAYLGTIPVTVYGGPGVVDGCFDLEPFDMVSGRVGGPDRCHTMAAAAAEVLSNASTEVLLVRDDQPIDAAIALPATVAGTGMVRPILLTSPTVLCPAILDLLARHPTVITVHVIGGAGAIAQPVIDALRAGVARPLDIQRHGGQDRYATAVAVATHMFQEINRPVLARGDDPHAALVATRIEGASINSPLLLTGDTLPAVTADYLQATKHAVRIVGDQQTVSATQRVQIHLLTTS